MNVAEFLKLLPRKIKGPNTQGIYSCFCPAHDDGKNPSLSVGEGTDGIVVTCHHEPACSAEDICHAVGIEVKDLFFTETPERTISEVYHYQTADSEALFEVVRFVPKGFAQRLPDGEWGLGDLERVPYRLPEVRQSIADGRWCLYVEGEKDVKTLERAGFVATTTAQGASGWRDSYRRWFAGARLAVIPDNDAAGRSFAHTVAKALAPDCVDLRIVELPGLGVGQDVSNWLISHDPDELQTLIREASQYAGEPVEPQIDERADQVTLTWPSVTIQITLERFRYQRREVHAEVTVSYGGTVILAGRHLDLQSLTTTDRLMTALRRHQKDADWHLYIEEACRAGLAFFRRGDTIVDLRTVEEPPAPSWLLEPLIEEADVSVLYGDGETGKSFLALACLLAVASGRPVAATFQPVHQTPVLYLDWETSRDVHRYRLGMLARGIDLNLTECAPIYYRREAVPLHESVDELVRYIKDRDVGLVCVDSNGLARGGSGSSDEDTNMLFAALRRLGTPTLALDHIDKRSAASGKDRGPFGSVYTRNNARLVWSAAATTKQDTTLLAMRNTKRNNGPRHPGLTLVYEWGDSTLRIDRTTTPKRRDEDDRGRIERYVHDRGPVARFSIASDLNLDPDNVSAHLTELKNQGRVTSPKRGVWEVKGDDEPPIPY